MRNLKIIIVLLSVVNLTFGNLTGYGYKYQTFNNCLNCAKSDNYFCYDTKASSSSNPWGVQCCHDSSTNPLCKPDKGENRECSVKFSESKGGYFGACPN